MTLREFSAVFAELANQLRFTEGDKGTIRAYYDALQDLDLALVAAAAREMARRGGAADEQAPHWFPKSSEWRAAVVRVTAVRVQQQQQARLERLHRREPPLCAACEDTGWRYVAGDRVVRCECRAARHRELLEAVP